jgi:hypothetical protein
MRSNYSMAHSELCYVRDPFHFRHFLDLPIDICSKCLKELWISDPLPDAHELPQDKIPVLIPLLEEEIERQPGELVSSIRESEAAGDSLRRFKKKHSYQIRYWKAIPRMVWECCT